MSPDDANSTIAALTADNAVLVAALRKWVSTYVIATRRDVTDAEIAELAAAMGAEDLLALPHPGAALLARLQAMEAFATTFAETAEAAVAHHETKGKGGQHVPFHGDFAGAPPSVVATLRRLAREAREALKEPSP